MLEEEIMLCHNCMFYIGAALLVISNHDEKVIRHFKKTLYALVFWGLVFFNCKGITVFKSGILVHKVKCC